MLSTFETQTHNYLDAATITFYCYIVSSSFLRPNSIVSLDFETDLYHT